MIQGLHVTRPFDLTLQAHRLDLHGLWVALLGVACLLALAWAWWAATDHAGTFAPTRDAAPPARAAAPTTTAEPAARPQPRPLSPIRTRPRE